MLSALCQFGLLRTGLESFVQDLNLEVRIFLADAAEFLSGSLSLCFLQCYSFSAAVCT